MFEVVLYQPEIPPNTGARLHLVKPLGFELEERRLRRAGLDYREWAQVVVHDSFDACRGALPDARWFALSTRGARACHEICFREGDAFVFGPETRGLPQALLDEFGPDQVLRLPMRPDNRSLNLSNAVAVVVYEAWRQLGFEGGV